MDIWHYHPATGVLLGQSQADPSPLEPGAYIIPALATDIAPPAPDEGKRAVWSGGAWTIEDIPSPEPPPVPTLADLQDAKRTVIRTVFESTANANVTAIGFTWQGGWDSAMKLDAAMRLSEAVGATDVEIFDIDNVGHMLDFATAQTVVIAVGMAFQSALAIKQALMRQIAAADTVEDLDAVVWPE